MSNKDFLLTPFATCAGTFNKKKDTFKEKDVTDIARCCLDFCEPQITYCAERCKNDIKKIFDKEIKNPTIEQKIGWLGKYDKSWDNTDFENLGYYTYNTNWFDRKEDKKGLEETEIFSSPEDLNWRCLRTCQYSRDLCLGQCRLIDPLTSDYNIYNNCASNCQNKVLKNIDDRGENTPSKECILKNKEKIMNCCLKKCKSKNLKNFNCKNYCTFLQNLIIKPETISPAYAKINNVLNQKTPLTNKRYKLYKDNTKIWVILGIILGIIISFLVLLILNKK